jgi:23S rRNA (guanosine2251-2'-O)-methyltransferase
MLAGTRPVNKCRAAGIEIGTMRKRGDKRRGQSAPPNGDAVIYGWHSVLAALRNPERQVRRLLATPNALKRLAEEGIPDLPAPVEVREIDRLAGPGAVHQGIALLAASLPERDVADLADARLVVVLDQVTDPHNVGAILRSAAAFAADAVILTERHGPEDSGLLAKAASGGLEHVTLIRAKNLARALDALAELGFLRLGLDSENAAPLESVALGAKTALVLGAEGKGLRRLTREKCDVLVRLAMPGAIRSLNVSNAAAVALYAVTRQAR